MEKIDRRTKFTAQLGRSSNRERETIYNIAICSTINLYFHLIFLHPQHKSNKVRFLLLCVSKSAYLVVICKQLSFFTKCKVIVFADSKSIQLPQETYIGSPSGYYKWLQNSEKQAIREEADFQDYVLLKTIYDASKGKVGYRGLYMALEDY